MKIKTTAILLLSIVCSAAQAHSAVTTRYYSDLSLYPGVTDAEWRSLASGGLQGLSESEILGQAQKKFFYLKPEPRNELAGYSKGCYIVTENDDKSTVRLEEPVRKFVILMEFAADTNSGHALLIRKTVKHRDEVLDTVEYYYEKGRVVRARSALYGDQAIGGKK